MLEVATGYCELFQNHLFHGFFLSIEFTSLDDLINHSMLLGFSNYLYIIAFLLIFSCCISIVRELSDFGLWVCQNYCGLMTKKLSRTKRQRLIVFAEGLESC